MPTARLGCGHEDSLDGPPILVRGVEDDVHLLCRFGRTNAQAEWVTELKRVSHLWLKGQGPDYRDFGYLVPRNPGL